MSDVLLPDQLPEDLLVAARKGLLIPLAGAGVSMSVRRPGGTSLFPSWHELLIHGAARLRQEAEPHRAYIVEGYVGIKEYLKAADELRNGLAGHFGDWIRSAVDRNFVEADFATLKLPQMLWALGSSLVLTTNYDRVLRWACPQLHDVEEWSRVPSAATIACLHPTIWHLHGNISDPASLVLAGRDYEALYGNTLPSSQAFSALLRDIIRNHTLLFVGFSFDDLYLQMEMAWLNQTFPHWHGRHYVLVPSDRLEHTKATLAHLTSLKCLPYASHGQPLLDLLSKLVTASGAGTQSDLPPQPLHVSGHSTSPALDAYLSVAQQVHGAIIVPGSDVAVRLEQVWVEPRFVTGDGETQLHRLLASRAVVFEAPAGAGKSTLARFLATVLARDRLKIPSPSGLSWQRHFLGVDPGKNTEVPLVINLRDVGPGGHPELLLQATNPELDKAAVNELHVLLAEGSVAFLLDGLDEVAPSQRPRLVALIQEARKRWPRCYFLLTTRPDPGTVAPLNGFTRAQIASMSAPLASQLLSRWAFAVLPNTADAQRFIEKARAAMARASDFESAMNTPLTVAFLCLSYSSERPVPASKAALFKMVTSWLLASRSHLREHARIDIGTTERVLEAVAVSLLRGGGESRGPLVMSNIGSLVSSASKILKLPMDQIERVIRSELLMGSCLTGTNERARFWHADLRDYFAARWFITRLATEASAFDGELREAFRASPWRECMDMFVAILASERPDDVLPLLESVGDIEGAEIAEAARIAAIRSRILAMATSQGYKVPSEYREKLRQEVEAVTTLSDEQLLRMEVPERTETLSTIGALYHDPRIRGKPSLRGMAIGHATNKMPVLVGRFPVTVQEFARFIKMAGYSDSRWRKGYETSFQPEWRCPLLWEEQKRTPNAPVTGVSWFEAMAYARWLQNQLGESLSVRLPRHEEWGQTATIQSTCSDRAPRRSQVSDELKGAIPVGVFPERRGPWGHDDLCGLIWEWLGPRSTTSQRRRRMQVTGWWHDDHIHMVQRNARGSQRSPLIGFRLVFEKLVQNGLELSSDTSGELGDRSVSDLAEGTPPAAATEAGEARK